MRVRSATAAASSGSRWPALARQRPRSLRDQLGGQGSVARDVAGVEQPHRRLQILVGDEMAWAMVRTLWSRPMPLSHTGYQTRSATAAMVSELSRLLPS